MIYDVRQTTTCEYASPVAHARHVLRLTPIHRSGQRVQVASLQIVPEPLHRREGHRWFSEVKPADHAWGFDPGKRVDHKVQRQVDPFIIYGIDAAGQAIEDAGLTDMTEEERYRAGCSIGAGIGGLPGIESESLVLASKGPKRVSPHFVHSTVIVASSASVISRTPPHARQLPSFFATSMKKMIRHITTSIRGVTFGCVACDSCRWRRFMEKIHS